jgi:hypothetical protein
MMKKRTKLQKPLKVKDLLNRPIFNKCFICGKIISDKDKQKINLKYHVNNMKDWLSYQQNCFSINIVILLNGKYLLKMFINNSSFKQSCLMFLIQN